MNFTSLGFLIFFPIAVFIYFSLPKYKNHILLVSSLLFYASWNLIHLPILLIVIFTSFFGAKLIKKGRKKIILLTIIAIIITLLFIFKYYNFVNNSLGKLFSESTLLLPIGLSFYTFKAISYVADLYKNKIKPEKSFISYAVYVSFFPQILAGPIERAANFLPQLKTKKIFNYSNAVFGLKIITWGLFQKVVVADRLAIIVNKIYDNPNDYSGGLFILATIFFAFQIYCDFAGYSNIAIGTAKILGFNTITNFNRPYFSKSISEFWTRWHISLSSWMRDYVYIPLGGNRVSSLRWTINILITFFISGLWHGANWTFVIWGLLNGIYIVLEKYIKKTSAISTFLLTCFAWIFFRSNNLNEAIFIIKSIIYNFFNLSNFNNLPISTVMLSIISIFVIIFFDYYDQKNSIWTRFTQKSFLLRWGFYYLLISSIFIFGVFQQSKFIYFKF